MKHECPDILSVPNIECDSVELYQPKYTFSNKEIFRDGLHFAWITYWNGKTMKAVLPHGGIATFIFRK